MQERDSHRTITAELRDSLRRQDSVLDRLRREAERLSTTSAAADSERVLLQRLVGRLESDLREREM